MFNNKLFIPFGNNPDSPIPSLPSPFTAALSNKAFTPHHAVWRALTSLFTTLLSHVRLPADVADEICHCLGSWISFFDPEYYFTYNWGASSNASGSESEPAMARNARVGEVDNAIRAMDAWNSDLTWFIFEEGRRVKTSRSVTTCELARIEMRMDLHLQELRESSHLNFAHDDKSERWKFAEVAF